MAQNYDEEFEFRKLGLAISQNTQELSNKVGSMRILVSKIGTIGDDRQLQENMKVQQEEAKALAQRIGQQLKALSMMQAPNSTEQRKRNMQQEKLRNAFTETLHQLTSLQKNAADRERASVDAAKRRVEEPSLIFESPQDIRTQEQQLAEDRAQLEDIHDREAVILKIEDSIQTLNDIFRDMAVMIQEQGEVIDSIEAHVEASAGYVEAANIQLTNARRHQASSAKKYIIMAAILCIVILVLGLIIYFTTKR